MAASPYDSLNTVLTAANVRLNDGVDTLLPLGGQLIGNTQAFSQQLVNTAWRKLQEFLVSLGYVRLQKEVILSGLAGFPLVPPDPGVQTYISWTAWFDGVTVNAAPVLPQDLIEPTEVWERATATAPETPGTFNEMDPIIGGMPAVAKLQWNGMWQWRDDALYLPGSTVQTDLRVRYAAYLADFADTGDVTTVSGWTAWFDQPVPIMRSFDSFVAYICAEVAKARENQTAALAYTAEAEYAAQMILNKDFMREKGTAKASEYSKMKDGFTAKGRL